MLKATRKKPSPAPAAPPSPAPQSSLKLVLLGWYGIVGLTLSYVLPFRFPFAEGYAKDHWRHALGSLLVALGVFAALLGSALYLLDANDFKSQIVDYVREHKQRELVLEGDLDLNFFPRLGLDTGRMSLSQRHSSRKFASVENARLYIAWWPLLRRQLQVERIVLDGLHANVERQADGSTNFDDLLAAAGQLHNVHFEVDKIRVLDSSLHYQDAAAGLAFTLHDLELETGRLADGSAGHVRSSFRLESSAPRIDARVRLGGHLLYDHAAQRLALADLEATAQGEAGPWTELALELKGALALRPALQQLTLEQFSLTAQGRLDAQALQARLDGTRLQIERSQWQARGWQFSGSLSQPDETLAARMTLPLLEADVKAWHSERVQAGLRYTSGAGVLEGEFSSPLQYERASRTLLLSSLQGQWNARHPLLASPLRADASARLQAELPQAAAQRLRLDFSTRLDDTELSGHVQLQDLRAPDWRFDLSAGALDLDRHLITHWPQWLQDEYEPFDLSALQALNLRGRLRGDALTLGQVRLEKVEAELRSEPGALSIEPLAAQLYGGTLQGGLRLATGDTPRLALQGQLAGVQLQPLQAAAWPGEAVLGGQASLAFDVQATGHTVAELRQELRGSASVALTQGTLAGLDVAEGLLAAREQIGLAGAVHADTVRLSEQTPYTELRATLAIGQDAVRSTDVLLRSPQLALRGEATLALDSGALQAQLATTVAPGLRRATAGELAELAGLSVPLQLSLTPGAATLRYEVGAASGAPVAKLARANQARIDAAPVAAAAPAPESAPTAAMAAVAPSTATSVAPSAAPSTPAPPAR